MKRTPLPVVLLQTALVTVLALGTMTVPGAGAETVAVIQVVDVATLRVEYQGLEETVRLIGIAAPGTAAAETGDEDGGDESEDEAALAADYVRTLVRPGDRVTLEFDVEPRDRENRLQAYVFLPDARFLNSVILLNGYATPVTEPPNVKYAGQLTWAYRNACVGTRGLWRAR
jgi:micrococcal nuclease